MSSKQPLISLDRPNNAAATQSLQAIIPAVSSQDNAAAAPVAETPPATVIVAKSAPNKVKSKQIVTAPTPAYQPATNIAPAVNTGDNLSSLSTRIPGSLHHNIKLYCVANGIGIQQFVQDALTEHLASKQNK